MNTITGIITTYGRTADVVECAVQSMISQTYPLLEILVIDDNLNTSPYCEALQKMCEKYKEVRYIKQDGNKGACAARNLGIKHAHGEYLAFLDDDDLWMPEKIEKQIKMFDRNDIGLVYCCGILRNENTGKESLYYNSKQFLPTVTLEDLLFFDYIGSTSQPLIRRECFEKVGGFWEEQPARQDYEMWIRIAKEYRIVGIRDQLFIHRIHDNEQISKNKRKCYIGYRNIYKRYKKNYRKSPRSEKAILRCILLNRDELTPEVVYYKMRYTFVKGLLKIDSIRKKTK